MGLFQEWLAERKERKEGKKEAYSKEFERAQKSKEQQKIRKRAYMMTGYKPSRKVSKGKWKKRQAKQRQPARQGRPTVLGVGREVPSFGMEENYASLMGEHRGMSIADYGMGATEKKKKKRGFSLADW